MSAATIVAAILTVAVGLSLGAMGGGGAVLMLPILVFVAGLDVREAVTISLVVVGGTSAAAFVAHCRRGEYHRKAAVLFAATGMVGAYAGARLTAAVSEDVLLLIFAGLMLVVGLSMLRDRSERAAAQCRTWPCVGIGTAVGILTGFLGVGGGFLIVPALVLFAGIETRAAIGTSLAIIAVNAAAGLLGQLRGGSLPWALALAFLVFALAGMGAGQALARRVSVSALRRAFASLVIALALGIGALVAAGLRLP